MLPGSTHVYFTDIVKPLRVYSPQVTNFLAWELHGPLHWRTYFIVILARSVARVSGRGERSDRMVCGVPR